MKQKTIQHGSNVELYNQIKELFHAGAQRLHRNHYRPKIYTDLQRVALLVLRVRTGYSYERFCTEYLPESKWPQWLGLRELPSAASVWRWTNRFDMNFLRELNNELLASEQPTTMAIDGTGLDADYKSAHYAHRIRATMKKGPKLDIIVDTDTLLIHDWSLLMRPRHDAHIAKSLLRRLRYTSIMVFGDKGYDSEELYQICHKKKMRFWAPLRNSTYENTPPKKLSWHKKQSHKKPLPTTYNRRSIVESAIRSLKNKVRALRARIHYMKKRELAWHILARNIEIKISLLLHYIQMLVRFAHHPSFTYLK